MFEGDQDNHNRERALCHPLSSIQYPPVAVQVGDWAGISSFA
jgi:hypothetical protein